MAKIKWTELIPKMQRKGKPNLKKKGILLLTKITHFCPTSAMVILIIHIQDVVQIIGAEVCQWKKLHYWTKRVALTQGYLCKWSSSVPEGISADSVPEIWMPHSVTKFSIPYSDCFWIYQIFEKVVQHEEVPHQECNFAKTPQLNSHLYFNVNMPDIFA